MKYNLRFYKDEKLKEVREEEVFMIGDGNRFISLDVPCSYDTIKLFCGDKKYIAIYDYRVRDNGKSVFERR